MKIQINNKFVAANFKLLCIFFIKISVTIILKLVSNKQ